MNREHLTVNGFYLGGFDVDYHYNYRGAARQYLVILTDGGELMSCYVYDYNMAPRIPCRGELIFELSVLHKNYKQAILRKVIPSTSNIPRAKINFLPPSKLKLNRAIGKLFHDKFPVVAVKGKVVDVQPDPLKYSHLFLNCTLVLQGENSVVNCIFGPYSRAEPYIDCDVFNIQKSPSIKELKLNLQGKLIGIVGALNQNTRDYTIQSSAIFDLGAEEDQ